MVITSKLFYLTFYNNVGKGDWIISCRYSLLYKIWAYRACFFNYVIFHYHWVSEIYFCSNYIPFISFSEDKNLFVFHNVAMLFCLCLFNKTKHGHIQYIITTHNSLSWHYTDSTVVSWLYIYPWVSYLSLHAVLVVPWYSSVQRAPWNISQHCNTLWINKCLTHADLSFCGPLSQI